MRLLTTLLLLCFICSSLPAQPSETEPAAEVSAEVKSGQVLEGSWRRPDGDYVIKINGVAENGMMQAGYFNPRPIRVASARWRFGGNRLQVRIDLNDTGYEGSYYLLQYNPESGKLEGEYTPAGQGVFPVEFERQLGPLAP
jgi:hypothetical protein